MILAQEIGHLVELPYEVSAAIAITLNNKIYVIGGRKVAGGQTNQVIYLNNETNQWISLENMPTVRASVGLAWFNGRIWAIGGWSNVRRLSVVESYNPTTNSWQTEKSDIRQRYA